DWDVVVAKLTPSGSLAYSTFIGGSTWDDVGYRIAVDAAGNMFILGNTGSTDFPMMPGYTGDFVLELNAAGNTIVWAKPIQSTNYPGLAVLAVDSNSNAYVAGNCNNSCGANNGFLTKLNPNGNTVYSRQFPNSYVFGVAVDSTGNVITVGQTSSTTFPVVNAARASLSGQDDGFVL